MKVIDFAEQVQNNQRNRWVHQYPCRATYLVSSGPDTETLTRIVDCEVPEDIKLEVSKMVEYDCFYSHHLEPGLDFALEVEIMNLRLKDPEICLASKAHNGEFVKLLGEIGNQIRIDEESGWAKNEFGIAYLRPGMTVELIYHNDSAMNWGRMGLVLPKPLLIELTEDCFWKIIGEGGNDGVFNPTVKESLCSTDEVMDELTQLRFDEVTRRLYDLATTEIDVDQIARVFAPWRWSVVPKTRHRLCCEVAELEAGIPEEDLEKLVEPYWPSVVETQERYSEHDEEVVLCLYGQIVDYVASLIE